jgi:hypothetical protein
MTIFSNQPGQPLSVGAMMGLVAVCIATAVVGSYGLTAVLGKKGRRPRQLPEDIDDYDFDDLDAMESSARRQYEPYDDYDYEGDYPEYDPQLELELMGDDYDDYDDYEEAPPTRKKRFGGAGRLAKRTGAWTGRQAKRGYEGVRRLPWGQYAKTARGTAKGGYERVRDLPWREYGKKAKEKASYGSQWVGAKGIQAYDKGARAYKKLDEAGWEQERKRSRARAKAYELSTASTGRSPRTERMPSAARPTLPGSPAMSAVSPSRSSAKTWVSAGTTQIGDDDVIKPHRILDVDTKVTPNRRRKAKGKGRKKNRKSRRRYG